MIMACFHFIRDRKTHYRPWRVSRQGSESLPVISTSRRLNSCQSLHLVFSIAGFISARAAAHTAQSSISKVRHWDPSQSWGGTLWLQTQTNSSILPSPACIKEQSKRGRAGKLDSSLGESGSYCRAVKKFFSQTSKNSQSVCKPRFV